VSSDPAMRDAPVKDCWLLGSVAVGVSTLDTSVYRLPLPPLMRVPAIGVRIRVEPDLRSPSFDIPDLRLAIQLSSPTIDRFGCWLIEGRSRSSLIGPHHATDELALFTVLFASSASPISSCKSCDHWSSFLRQTLNLGFERYRYLDTVYLTTDWLNCLTNKKEARVQRVVGD
jgi:hypothetical protein